MSRMPLPDPSWAWRTAFDVGEYELGQYAEPLQRGVDVPSNAVFFNENAAADSVADGAVVPLPHAEAMFERDGGSLWDRPDPSTYERDARLARELVVTAAYVIGNYTYDVEYSFRLDGSIGVRVGRHRHHPQPGHRDHRRGRPVRRHRVAHRWRLLLTSTS